MDYNEYNDHELLMLISENNDDARNIIYQKYHYIIDIIFKKYYKKALSVAIEPSDLFQEALLGFTDALNRYREDEVASFATFATLCVDRRIQRTIRDASTIKNKVTNDTVSLEYEYDDNITLKDIITDEACSDPLNEISKQEENTEFNNKVKEALSDNEYLVYELMIKGYNYLEIAKILNKEPKQIDNTMQRIRNKIKKMI